MSKLMLMGNAPDSEVDRMGQIAQSTPRCVYFQAALLMRCILVLPCTVLQHLFGYARDKQEVRDGKQPMAKHWMLVCKHAEKFQESNFKVLVEK